MNVLEFLHICPMARLKTYTLSYHDLFGALTSLAMNYELAQVLPRWL